MAPPENPVAEARRRRECLETSEYYVERAIDAFLAREHDQGERYIGWAAWWSTAAA